MSEKSTIIDDVKVKIEKKPDCKIEMEVTASSELVKSAKKKAIKSVGKEIELPGFRKGKAPAEIVIKKYPEQVKERWQKAIADEAFMKAQQKEQITVLNNNSPITFNMKNFSDEGAEMTFSFETEPSIPTIDISKFSLKEVKRQKIEKKEIDEYLKQVQLMYAEWREVEGRPIQEKDYVILDIESAQDPDKGQKIFSDTRFEVTKKAMADWMRTLIVGKNKGDVLEGISKADKDATEKEKKESTEKKVKITIKKIEEPKTLALDDTFAKGLNFPSMKDLNEYAEKMLNDKADQAKESEERIQANTFLLKHTAELPLSLINAEINHRKKQHLDNPAFKANFDKMEAPAKKEFEDRIKQDCTEAVLLFYLSRKVCQDANLPIEYAEIEREGRRILMQAGVHDLKEVPKEVKALSLSRILLRKAQDHILQGGKKLDQSK